MPILLTCLGMLHFRCLSPCSISIFLLCCPDFGYWSMASSLSHPMFRACTQHTHTFVVHLGFVRPHSYQCTSNANNWNPDFSCCNHSLLPSLAMVLAGKKDEHNTCQQRVSIQLRTGQGKKGSNTHTHTHTEPHQIKDKCYHADQ